MLSARSLEPKINSKTHKLEDMLSIDCGENLSIEIYEELLKAQNII